MNREDLYVLHAMAQRQKQLYESITTGAVVYLLYSVVGGYGLIAIGLGLVALVILAIVIRYVASQVRRLWRASEAIRAKIYKPWLATKAIRDKLSRVFNLDVLYGCLAAYFMGSVIIYTIYEGVKSLL